jgi:hypothetical protein
MLKQYLSSVHSLPFLASIILIAFFSVVCADRVAHMENKAGESPGMGKFAIE